MLQAVLFDAAETLFRPVESYGAVYSAVAARFGMRIPAEFFRMQMAKALGEIEWPLRTSPEQERAHWRDLVLRIGKALPSTLDAEAWFVAVYGAFAQPEVWRIEPGAVETLEALRREGLKIGVLSNWDERLHPVLAGLGLAERVDGTFVAPTLGWRKPAREAFHGACAALGVEPGKTLHIGDSKTDDLQGARGAGLHALLYQPGDVTALRRLPDLLHSSLVAAE